MITATYFKNHLSDLNFEELRFIQYKFQWQHGYVDSMWECLSWKSLNYA